MNRRDSLKSMAAALAAFVLPAPRRHIDLAAYCGEKGYKYDLRLPFSLEDWTYATDRRICVRVRPILGDMFKHHGKIPPFEGIGWNHDRLTGLGWRSFPKLEPMLASDSLCPACNGYGNNLKKPETECPKCEGTGPIYCDVCNGDGTIMPPGAVRCSYCNGKAIGTFPGIVSLDGVLFERDLYEKARRL